MPSRVFAACFLFVCAMIQTPRPALAACFEIVGCTSDERFSGDALRRFSCQNLAFLRNTIYAENGYCFKSPEYSTVFLKETCRYSNASDVPLNEYESANVTAILKAEKGNGCR